LWLWLWRWFNSVHIEWRCLLRDGLRTNFQRRGQRIDRLLVHPVTAHIAVIMRVRIHIHFVALFIDYIAGAVVATAASKAVDQRRDSRFVGASGRSTVPRISGGRSG